MHQMPVMAVDRRWRQAASAWSSPCQQWWIGLTIVHAGKWRHVIWLPVNNQFPQNDYHFCY